VADSTNGKGNGVGFLSLLCLLFIGLRLGDVITWSWWWVMAPIWIPLLLVAGVFLVGLAVIAVRKK